MFVSALLDERVKCWSFMLEMSVKDYLERVETAYANRGGLEHQRTSLRTASAKRIRARMVRDLIRGAVLPPLVIGVVKKVDASKLKHDHDEVLRFLGSVQPEALAIIDGMQRTTALQDAVRSDASIAKRILRVEIWVADSTESLIYRMLVLNAGQVPWNLKQQLLVVYEPLIKEIEESVQLGRLLGKGDRRWRGGEFSADDLIETYIAFGLRKTEVDTQESLAEEFSKLDIADALSERRYDTYYFPILQMMVQLDLAFSSFEPPDEKAPERGAGGGKIRRKYSRGKNIFDTQPPRIGFVVANAVYILGRIGMNKDSNDSLKRLNALRQQSVQFCERFQQFNSDQMAEFLALDVLQEKLQARPTSAVGRWERSFWESAFSVLLSEGYEIPNMEPCWRAG